MMCAAAAVGARADNDTFEQQARTLAADERWRVREGVAIGLQMLGDVSWPALASTVRQWADDSEPLVQRAAVAAVCEPRLLRTREAAAVAIEICARTTQHLTALPPEQRRRPEVRTLRQALGYGWSVAVAADPDPGIARFAALDASDPDVAWIITQNRGKKRLAALL